MKTKLTPMADTSGASLGAFRSGLYTRRSTSQLRAANSGTVRSSTATVAAGLPPSCHWTRYKSPSAAHPPAAIGSA